jgi:precorrin-6B methylase 2
MKEMAELIRDNQKQLDNNKENLKLVAGECLKAIEQVDSLKNT